MFPASFSSFPFLFLLYHFLPFFARLNQRFLSFPSERFVIYAVQTSGTISSALETSVPFLFVSPNRNALSPGPNPFTPISISPPSFAIKFSTLIPSPYCSLYCVRGVYFTLFNELSHVRGVVSYVVPSLVSPVIRHIVSLMTFTVERRLLSVEFAIFNLLKKKSAKKNRA